MLSTIINFVTQIGFLKKVIRTGWRRQVGIKNPESVAEHTFRCVVLAMCIADIKGLKSEKLLRMLLLHDIHEALTGDHDHVSKQKIGEEKMREMAKNAINKMLNELPRKLKDQYYSLWLEFDEGVTDDAKLAHEIDQLELTMQALEYEKDGYDTGRLSVFWENVENKISETSELFIALKKIRDSNN